MYTKYLSNIGYSSLSAMQKEAMENIRLRNNIILLSPTGTGKTLGFLLPIVVYKLKSNPYVQVVVISPSRELSQQSEIVFKSLKSPFFSLSLHGGRSILYELKQIENINPQILFVTPGRFNDHLNKKNINTTYIETLIIDEYDKCLEYGFHLDMKEIIKNIAGTNHLIMTSATEIDSLPSFLTKKISSKFIKLDYLKNIEEKRDKIKITAIKCPSKDKLETLGKLLSVLKNKHSIVFLAHRESVERVGCYLKSLKFVISLYHGGMQQEDREKNLSKFRSKCSNILIATDLASRGLNIMNIESVIHYHIPSSYHDYLHRIGRTGRWENNGETYFLLSEKEELPSYIPENTSFMNINKERILPVKPLFKMIYIGKGKKDKLSKGDIVGFLCKKGNLEISDIGNIDITTNASYVSILRNKVKQCLSLVQGEKIKGIKTIIEEIQA